MVAKLRTVVEGGEAREARSTLVAVAFGGGDLVTLHQCSALLGGRAGGILNVSHPRIILDLTFLAGKPVVRGNRLLVEG